MADKTLKIGDQEIKYADIPQEDLFTILESEGFIIRDKEQEAKFIENKQAEWIADKTKEWHERLRGDVLEASGLSSESNEKSYEYLKRAFGEKDKKIKEIDKELAEIKEKGFGEHEQNKHLEEQLAKVKADWKADRDQYEGKIGDLNGKIFTDRKNARVNEALDRLRPLFRADLDPEILQDSIESKRAKFEAEVKAVDLNGSIVWQTKEGKPITDSKTGDELSLFDILKSRYDTLIDKKRVQNGLGLNPEDITGGKPGGGEGADKYKQDLPDTVKDQNDLMDYLKGELKLAPGSEEFTKTWDANKGELPIIARG